MDNQVILQLAAENQMGGVDNLVNIYWALSGVLVAGVEGAVVEIGCYEGRASVLLRMVIDHFDPKRELHVYDSFQGLPAAGPHDTDYTREGQLTTSVENLLATFARWGVDPPVVHPGWFHETLPAGLPDSICFAYLDGDLYESVRVSLECVYPRLPRNAVVIIDDYCDPGKSPKAFPMFPGTKKACDEFFANKPEDVSVLVGSHNLAFGYFRKS